MLLSCVILEQSEESRLLDARLRASILTSPVILRDVPLAHGGLVAERRGGEGSARMKPSSGQFLRDLFVENFADGEGHDHFP
jgi:hypothetical protein